MSFGIKKLSIPQPTSKLTLKKEIVDDTIDKEDNAQNLFGKIEGE